MIQRNFTKGENVLLTFKIFYLFVLSMCVSTVTYTITRSVLFKFLRNWVLNRNETLGKFIGCPYCLSHWVTAFFVILLYVYSPIIMVTDVLLLDATITMFATIGLVSIIINRLLAH